MEIWLTVHPEKVSYEEYFSVTRKWESYRLRWSGENGIAGCSFRSSQMRWEHLLISRSIQNLHGVRGEDLAKRINLQSSRNS